MTTQNVNYLGIATKSNKILNLSQHKLIKVLRYHNTKCKLLNYHNTKT